MSTKGDQLAAMRAKNRAGFVAALADGRRQVAAAIPSGRRYKRRPKHGGWS